MGLSSKAKALSVLGVAVLVGLCGIVTVNYHTLVFLRRISASGMTPQSMADTLRRLDRALPKTDGYRYVLLAIPAKMGTTWTGHIAHQLVTRGAEVDHTRNQHVDVPYPDFAKLIFGKELHELDPPYWQREPWGSRHPGVPVIIRTHCPHKDREAINVTEAHGYRVVTVLRDPTDTVLSAYRFIPTVTGVDPADISVDFFVKFMRFAGFYDRMFNEYVDFWERRHHPDVLVLLFEDMKADLSASVQRLADFLAVQPPLSAAEVARVVRQSSHAFMSAEPVVRRFNEAPPAMRAALMRKMGVTEADFYVPQAGLVRKGGGTAGAGKKVLPPSVRAMVAEMWATTVLPRTGCTSYEDMRRKLTAERETDPHN